MKDFIKIHEKDNVIVALHDIAVGQEITIDGKNASFPVKAVEAVPAGHKMAISDIAEGSEVIKYGFRIGNAKTTIRTGQWVHIHNVKTALGEMLSYTYVCTPYEEKAQNDKC